jgi:hypothetical protein
MKVVCTYTITTRDLCDHPQDREGMCGCPEGTDALDALFLDFLAMQKPGTPIEVTLRTKDGLLWAPPYVVDLEGEHWQGKLSFISQLPEMNDGIISPDLTPWSYEWAAAKWGRLFSVTMSCVTPAWTERAPPT